MATPRRKTRLSILADQELQPQAFRFSPRGPLSRAPRLWDRKPTAPANPKSKNREVWKRVLAQGNERGMLREMGEGKMEERGVKRMRVRAGGDEEGFLETKWMGGDGQEGRRKLRMELKSHDGRDENGGSAMDHEVVTRNELNDMDASISDCASGSARHNNNSLAYHHGHTLAEHTAVTAKMPDTQARPIHPTSSGQAFTVTLPPSLTQNRNASSILSPNPAQSITETALLSSPSSRLRYKGLEGDLAEVLSDFLSKAKAKRAANSAAQESEKGDTLFSKDDDETCKPSTSLLARSRGPRTPNRRALDVLDKNSPSPALSPSRYGRTMVSLRSQTAASKRKVAALKVKASAANEETEDTNMGGAETANDKEPEDEEVNIDEEKEAGEDKEATEQAESSTSTTPSRRKTRSCKKRSPPRVRTINLRRPTGNEFVFQPRTEAQELALKTRANTRKNKGKAKSVQAFLKEQEEKKAGGKNENQKDKTSDSIDNDEPVTPDRRKRKGKKNVHFDDDNLVDFFEEPEQKFLSLDDIATPTRRSKRKAAAPIEESTTADAEADGDCDEERPPLPLFSPSVPRKVRRLGPAKRKKGALTGSGPVKAKKGKAES